jgi:hypothetical protein
VRHIHSSIGAQILVKPKNIEHFPVVVVRTEVVNVDCSGHSVSCRQAEAWSEQGLVQLALRSVEDHPDVISLSSPFATKKVLIKDNIGTMGGATDSRKRIRRASLFPCLPH